MSIEQAPDAQALISGNRRALAKAITLIESRKTDHHQQAQALLSSLLPHTGNSIRIGITGIPGVGKSTFIEALGLSLIDKGHRVAVLAVDPSSPLKGGSILGDKTRMEQLSRSQQAFIRPSPSEGSLGGVAQKTRESILLCEAAGYDVILVETVGVGQSEYEVASMVDFFLVLMLPNAGDELQGIKRGIMELADALVINKADGDFKPAAENTRNHYQNALHLLQNEGPWTPQILSCSALHNEGIEEVWNMITTFREQAQQSGALDTRRKQQNLHWLDTLIQIMLLEQLSQSDRAQVQLKQARQAVADHQMTPLQAAQSVLDVLRTPCD
ncbi:MAG: methylmalonyl Co-A mutase-associated GTPase MeaB [Oleiphilus sp.]|nr:MAG: methylmalonyl Co-A mutase-associated GTPase MeaB [Oleiphilus sp.]